MYDIRMCVHYVYMYCMCMYVCSMYVHIYVSMYVCICMGKSGIELTLSWFSFRSVKQPHWS